MVPSRYSSDDVQGLEVDGESDCKDKEDEVKRGSNEWRENYTK